MVFLSDGIRETPLDSMHLGDDFSQLAYMSFDKLFYSNEDASTLDLYVEVYRKSKLFYSRIQASPGEKVMFDDLIAMGLSKNEILQLILVVSIKQNFGAIQMYQYEPTKWFIVYNPPMEMAP
jgi:hypothetical protein